MGLCWSSPASCQPGPDESAGRSAAGWSALDGGASRSRSEDEGVDHVAHLADDRSRSNGTPRSAVVVVADEEDGAAGGGVLPQVEDSAQCRGRHQTLLFSATLDGVVNTLIKRYQTDLSMHEVVSEEVTVEQMTHRFVAVHKMDKAKEVSIAVG